MLKNIIPTLKELREHYRVCGEEYIRNNEAKENESGRSQRGYYGGFVGSYCVASFYNTEYCVTLCIWNNDYGACPEIGLRNLQTDNFELNKQDCFGSCALRFIRLAKLIQAGRKLKI